MKKAIVVLIGIAFFACLVTLGCKTSEPVTAVKVKIEAEKVKAKAEPDKIDAKVEAKKEEVIKKAERSFVTKIL